MAEIRMPKMGDGMEEGTINSWFKKEGDQIKEGEAIAEVETDKANVEIAAYETGTLTKIIVQPGQTVPVGEIIAIIGSLSAAAGANGATNAPQVLPSSDVQNGAGGAGTPRQGDNIPPTIVPANTHDTDAVASEAGFGPSAERVKASPLARRMAAEMHLDLARIKGTGPGGRIVERDIKSFAQSAGAPAKANETPGVQTGSSAVAVPAAVPPPTRTSLPASGALTATDSKPNNMRKAIANRTVQSKQNIPHFYVSMSVEMDRALALLKELNVDATEGKVTINDLIVKACAGALSRVPEVNATWTPEGTVRRYAEAHIGIAVGIEDGLIIPVVRDCHSKTLRQISGEAKSLIGKARNNQLKPEEYSGGTFSVSNLGMMGVDEFIAIINPPEAAILAIGGAFREPVVLDNDAIVVRTRMKITLSADHRLLDGVVAARFLQDIKKSLEAPFSLLS